MLMAQGRFKEASARFARALELVPELAENFADTMCDAAQGQSRPRRSGGARRGGLAEAGTGR